MTLKVGINGFGRIGRMALRSIIEQNRKDLEVVAINNKGNAEISSFLLANDTIHGKLKSKINHSEKAINIDGKKINMIQENEISKIDWKKYKVNIVLECTGKFNTKEKSSRHINSKVVSMPCQELFDKQPKEYKDKIIEKNSVKISIEAGSILGWEKYVGPSGISLGIKSFGKSAPYKTIYEYFNLTSDNIVKLTKKMLDK